MKNLDKTFFNSVEEMNECYGINEELPSNLHSNSDLVCYEIIEPFAYEEVCQYKFDEDGIKSFSLGRWFSNLSGIDNEILLNKHDFDNYEGRCFVYVRVNEYLRKHLEKTLIGCEFIHYTSKSEPPFRRFVHSVEVRKLGAIATDQNGFISVIDHILLYPDDHSDPIPYKEWVKKLNEQEVEG